ncbi:hypothetical protein FOA43_000200 [Brettanomyces nanus]|uniref:DNA-(apurinic or apyrimidinic site) endonuclease 2 n=1 Tax=Eeniella nana TaxID=13502 RepID=A0A875RSV2_EENNA|nr:uncharacterized protein FOA43_000200 [Brettanomyces nanus]QPG72897.1 hypothetical protein FOA43_000200 [Brettanomyces nanus]
MHSLTGHPAIALNDISICILGSVGMGDIDIPSKFSNTSLRLVSFNVNGVKTLKNYYPWNQRPGYDNALHFMKADIVTFQELKLQREDIDVSIANPTDYKAFITVPQSRKGYSGVGVFVRKPTDQDSDMVKRALTVVKAEEGITGYFHLKRARKSYRDCSIDDKYKDMCIGGFPALEDPVDGRHLDSEGRCILIELAIGLVIISVYCPANSGLTEEGENFRLLFLRCLFERAENLMKMGKEVVIMGDINVSPDLIDNDDSINEGFIQGIIKKSETASEFENINKAQALSFKNNTEARRLLNSYLFDTTKLVENESKDKIIHDITREIQGRRLKMYSVWNTLKNNRPVNIGSRIDLFLATSGIASCARNSDIWRDLYGSDHCPIYCDLELNTKIIEQLANRNTYTTKCNCRHMEAKNYYSLGNSRGISSFFRKPEKHHQEDVVSGNQAKKTKSGSSSVYVSRKRTVKSQRSLTRFFSIIKKTPTENDLYLPPSSSGLFVGDSDEEDEPDNNQEKHKSSISATEFRDLLRTSSFSSAPLCSHNERCALRTVKNSNSGNVGKRFWCCSRQTKNETWNFDKKGLADDTGKQLDEYNCGYFKWVEKR